MSKVVRTRTLIVDIPARLLRHVGIAIIVLTVISFGIASVAANGTPPIPVPQDGQVYSGVQLDWANDSVDNYSSRLGRTPAVFGRYVKFPLSTQDRQSLNSEIQVVAAHKAMFMLTLEPWPGLSSLTTNNLQDLTKKLTSWNNSGVPVFVRFAHEMNGSWYPWGQQPSLYIKTFRNVAIAVRQAPKSAMLWSPNDGGGYPFSGGPYEAKQGSADFNTLDTNRDGKLSMSDDPYTPYYPGDAYVDWVGLSLYHFGTVYPWGENEVPSPGKLIGKITGTYSTAYVDERAVPNFYANFADGHNKPFALSETGAFYNASRTDGASALDIKSAWWQQLFDPTLSNRFPRLKMASWFEYAKQETDTGNDIIDWRVTADPTILNAFKTAVPSRFIFTL